MIDIPEGKILDLIKNIMAEVLGIACRSDRGKLPCLGSEKQRQHGHYNKQDPCLDNVAHIPLHDPDVNDVRHQKRNQHFHQYLQRDKHRSQK